MTCLQSSIVILAPLLLVHAAATANCATPDEDGSCDALSLLQSQFAIQQSATEGQSIQKHENVAAQTPSCESWCANKVAKGKNTWDTLCGWTKCAACTECPTTTTTSTTTTTTTQEYWQSPYFMMTCSGQQAFTTESMTYADYDAAVSSVQGLYYSLDSTCNATYCPQADFAGCVLRIAGHDFMDYRDGTGGSDGCMDLHDADNNGLHECIYAGEHGVSLNDVYPDFCTQISLADFFVISAEAIMNVSRTHVVNEDSSRGTVDFRSRFQYGRTTGVNCDFAHGRLPNPENSCSAVETTFVNSMGLSWQASAALMGVHSLGRASIANSGYNGWWSDFENSRRFNNDYYVSIVTKGWGPEKAVNGNSAKNQWKRIDVGVDEAGLGKEMMLDTDMCLYFTSDDDGEVELKASNAEENECTCAWAAAVQVQNSYNNYADGKFCGTDDIPGASNFPRQRALCCGLGDNYSINDLWMDCGLPIKPMGPAASFVRAYANDEDKWITQFMRAWTIATSNGFTGALKKIRS